MSGTYYRNPVTGEVTPVDLSNLVLTPVLASGTGEGVTNAFTISRQGQPQTVNPLVLAAAAPGQQAYGNVAPYSVQKYYPTASFGVSGEARVATSGQILAAQEPGALGPLVVPEVDTSCANLSFPYGTPITEVGGAGLMQASADMGYISPLDAAPVLASVWGGPKPATWLATPVSWSTWPFQPRKGF